MYFNKIYPCHRDTQARKNFLQVQHLKYLGVSDATIPQEESEFIHDAKGDAEPVTPPVEDPNAAK